MSETKTSENTVNEDGTSGRADAAVTRGRSGPVRKYIIRDHRHRAWGPFDHAEAAIDWARAKWPDIPQDSGMQEDDWWWGLEPLNAPVPGA